MGAATADQVVFFDDRHRLALLSGLHGGPFPSWTGTNYDNVVLLIVHFRTRLWICWGTDHP